MNVKEPGQRVVIKVGSSLLVDPSSRTLRSTWLASLALDVARLRERGSDVVIVSSGSIALGRSVLGLEGPSLALEHSQAAAAVGQIRLARAYEETLAPHGITAAQVLVTLEDSADRRRYLNSRATLEALLSMGVVPIVNENDTVATDEIRYGDNDRLAAQVAVTVEADQLILLSDIDGLYSADPRQDHEAVRFDLINVITPELEAMAGDARSGLSRGGMKTKLMAAKTATAGGCAMAITEGSKLSPISELFLGAPATWFTAQVDRRTARKRWILSMKPIGQLVIDAGAAQALKEGNSLLPVGVTQVIGEFSRGDAVVVLDQRAQEIARGVSSYTADEARSIMGLKSVEVAQKLGEAMRVALVHRDDLVT